MKRIRIFSLLLAAVVAATSMPVAVSAAESSTGATTAVYAQAEDSVAAGDSNADGTARNGGTDGSGDSSSSGGVSASGGDVAGNAGENQDDDRNGDAGEADGTGGTDAAGGQDGTAGNGAADGEDDPSGGNDGGQDSGDAVTEPGSDAGEEDGEAVQPEDPSQPEISAPAVTVKLNTASHIRYMNGSSDGMFYPSSALTRAEAAQMINSLISGATAADVVQNVSFSDVAADAWYAGAVNSLAGYGVLNGSGGAFRPESFISRAEFVAMLSKFGAVTESDRTFSDVPESHWAHDIVASAAEQGWISGYADGTFHPDGTLSRAEAAAVTNRVLGRSADKNTVNSGYGIRIFPDLEKWHWAYYDIMEASIGHEHSGSGENEVWTSFTKETTSLSVGTHVINGILYRVKSDGTFAANEYADGHWYDTMGRYVTGNETLDELMRAATRACVTSGMTQHEMLKSAFNYMINNYTYLSRAKLTTGATGWTEEYAVPMFQKHKGNCYSFAAAYYYLAKNIGYNPREVAGLVGYNRRPHGWIEIDINGQTYIYDTELTMAKRRDGYNYYLFEMTYRNAPFVYAKR